MRSNGEFDFSAKATRSGGSGAESGGGRRERAACLGSPRSVLNAFPSEESLHVASVRHSAVVVTPDISAENCVIGSGKAARSYSRHGLNALKARVKLRGLGAIDRRTAAAREMLARCDEMLADLRGADAVTAAQRALVEAATRTASLRRSLGHGTAIAETRHDLRGPGEVDVARRFRAFPASLRRRRRRPSMFGRPRSSAEISNPGEDRAALHRVFKLTDIARPVIALHQRDGMRGQALEQLRDPAGGVLDLRGLDVPERGASSGSPRERPRRPRSTKSMPWLIMCPP
jgi:hypothetical protein